MKKNYSHKSQMKKVIFPAAALVVASLSANITFAQSGNGMIKNDSNPINTAVQKTKKGIKDTMITGIVQSKFAKNDLLNALKINVKTVNGNVQLSGMVDTDMQYEQAIMLADSVEGVNNVEAKSLKVKDSQQPVKDTYITAKVKGQLLKDKVMGKNIKVWPVSVETKNGVVYLKGEVESDTQKDSILKSVKSVEGVKSVKSDITISSDDNEVSQSQVNNTDNEQANNGS